MESEKLEPVSLFLGRLDGRMEGLTLALASLQRAHEQQGAQILAAIEKHADLDTARFSASDERLKKLEGWRRQFIGYFLGGTGIGGALLWIAEKLLK